VAATRTSVPWRRTGSVGRRRRRRGIARERRAARAVRPGAGGSTVRLQVAGLDDPSAWLDGRRFHYDAVIGADGSANAAAATQPQGLRLSLADLLDAGGGPLTGPDLSAVLAEAGIAPATARSG
jgi:hypothetical protein